MPAKTQLSVPKSWPWWRWVCVALCIVALALSAFLSWHYLAGGSVIGCGDGSPCQQVLSSRWSSVGGVLPVSGLAAGAYLALLVAILFIGPATPMPDRRMAWGAMLVIVGAAAGSAIWFTIVQKWIIKSFCPYCMTAHISGLLLAVLVIWRATRQYDNDPSSVAQTEPAPNAAPRRILGRLPLIGLPLAGLILAGVLAVCQIVFTPPPAYRAGTGKNIQSALDPRAVPLVGSPDAAHLVILFFDYQCSHCQRLHLLLDEAVRRYRGKLAFALCPAPLNSQCNPFVAYDRDEFMDSCELARTSLAVWVADSKAFAAFDNWMFSPDPGSDLWRPRRLDAARAKAAEMLGQARFDAARADPRVDAYMKTAVRIYGDTVDQSGNSLPRLAFGTRWLTPEPEDADDFMTLLRDRLRVPAP